MLSKIPIILESIGKENMDKEILRTGIIAELDAINLYEQMAAMTKDKYLKKILFDSKRRENSCWRIPDPTPEERWRTRSGVGRGQKRG